MLLLRRPRSFSCLIAACTAALALAPAVPAVAGTGTGYTNPFAGASATVGRTDMGVDLCLNPGDPIRAIGNGTVIGIQRNWYAGQPYIWYELSDGSHAGDYVYVAEQIDHLARVGQSLRAGDVIARYASKGSCIETGWSMANGATEAAATTGYVEGQPTQAGVSFARFLASVGVSGQFELTAATPQAARLRSRRRHRKTPVKPHVTPPVTTPAPTAPKPKPKPTPKPKPAPQPTPVASGSGSGSGSVSGSGSGTTVSSGPGQPGSGPYPQPNFGPTGNEPYWPH